MTVEHILEDLIAFKTVSGNRKEMGHCLRYVKDALQPVPLYIREYEFEGHPILVITPNQRKRAKLWLAAHIDVVPGEESQFTPVKKAGKLYGRGAFDMKFAAASYLAVLRELGMDVRNYDLGVILTSDEELGMESSVKYLLEEHGYRGEVVFLPDGTGSWHFEEAVKGAVQVEVTAHGNPSHGSRPWLGRSAVHELVHYVNDAVKAFDAFKTNGAEHWYTTMHAGLIEGGEAFNSLAAHAKARLDIRYITKTDHKKVRSILAMLHKRYPHTKSRVLHHSPSYGITRTNGYAKAWAHIAKELYNIDCGWARAHGRSDALWFTKAGMPTILISPKGGDSHGDREWVDIRDLGRYAAILRVFIERVARK